MAGFIKFSNRFTKAFKVKHPIVLAPMGGIAGVDLVSAVSKAGGLGFLGTGGQNPNTKVKYIGVGDIVSKLHQAQKEAGTSESVGVGLNVQGCLDKDTPVLDQILSINPHNLWLSTHGHAYANPGPFCRLALSTRIAVNLFVQVETPEDAKIAALTGAHCIVLKGNSSGGTWRQNKESSEAALYNSIPNNHNQQEASIEHKTYPLSKLIPDSKHAIEELNLKNPPFLIAAGGITSGEDVAHSLQLGADAICIGTLFAVAAESELTTKEKLKFATGASLPLDSLEAHEARSMRYPDGSTVKIGDSKAYKFFGNDRNVLHDCVNMPVKEIIDEIMDDLSKYDFPAKA